MGFSIPFISKTYRDLRIKNCVSVNVFGFEKHDDENSIFPIRLTRDQLEFDHINFLLLLDGEGNFHYCLIKDMNSLIAHRTKHRGRTYVCDHGIHPFTSEKALNNHILLCSDHKAQRVKLAMKRTNGYRLQLFVKHYESHM